MGHFKFQACAKAKECHFVLFISPFLSYAIAMLPIESLAMLEEEKLLIGSKLPT
jgi:hypothetical protein